MASKWKKRLKKAAKIAVPVLGALALAKGLGKRKLSKAVSGTDDAGLGVKHFQDYITKKAKPKINISSDDPMQYQWPNKAFGARGGGIAKRGMGAAYKSGGRVKSMGIAKRGGGVAKR